CRSGYKSRQGYEGGQFRLFMKLPIRGFNNKQFQKRLDGVNLDEIERVFNDGELVNEQSLIERGLLTTQTNGVKILGNGELKKSVTIEAHAISAGAKDKLQKAKISFKLLPLGEAKSVE